ncbi:MAG: glycoside hydrolase family 130 protein [Desulfobacterota bacterium]|nr:glycoside hydrolase family 130 protein [Thermodesulfobacteriota bacterium]
MCSPGQLVIRYHNNPILTPDDIPYPVATVHNAGVVKFQDRYVMLFRSHQRNGRSVIGRADSSDGFSFSVYQKPFMVPAADTVFGVYEEFGIEDLRITPLEGAFYLTYSCYSRFGVRIGLARTYDFHEVERIAIISHADMRNVVLFPERIQGRYARLDRPHTNIMPWSIWLSFSPDLIHWGESVVVIRPMQYHWDEMKIGPGTPPIKTKKGWLHIYHGVFQTMAGAVYRLGVALHDLENPAHVLGVGDEWIVEPHDPWERTGYVPNVVFTCGAVTEDGKNLILYWGGADTVMCAGVAQIDALIEHCLKKARPAMG